MPEGSEITKFRSIVGELMYLAGERPDTTPGEINGKARGVGHEDRLALALISVWRWRLWCED